MRRTHGQVFVHAPGHPDLEVDLVRLLEAGGDVEVLEVRELLGEAEDVGGDPLGLVVVLLPVEYLPDLALPPHLGEILGDAGRHSLAGLAVLLHGMGYFRDAIKALSLEPV